MTAKIGHLGVGIRTERRGSEVREVREFEELVVSRGAALLRFALMLCGDAQLAEDLVQTVLARAYRRWSSIERTAQPEAYLKKMLVNEHLSWRRRLSSRELPTSLTTEVALLDCSAAQASRDAAWALLARLPRRQRAVLVLRYYEDLSDEQIADVLGCGISTVRSNASRALATLRTTVTGLDEEVLP
jgi:RNA polymerase sigma-70 factor (sigma-E family)